MHLSNIEKDVKGYILENVNMIDSELDNDVEIFEQGLVNSLFAIELMTFLEKKFHIKVNMDDLDMSNFKSINSIKEFINKKKQGEK